MFGKEENLRSSRIARCKMQAINGRRLRTPCACEIKSTIESFFNQIMEEIGKNYDCDYMIERIAEAVMYLANNTRDYEKLTEEEISSLRNIFNELKKLYDTLISKSDTGDLKDKITCISEILCKNSVDMHDDSEDQVECPGDDYRDGMIFQRYEDLWKVVNRISTEWSELRNRGFDACVIFDYWSSVRYDRENKQEKTEDEKVNNFMSLLDGTMKFVPVYEEKAVAYGVVANDFEGKIVNKVENFCYKTHRLRQKGEEITQ